MKAIRRSWVLAAIVLGLTFSLGALTGGGIVNALVDKRLAQLRALGTAEGFAERVRSAIGPVAEGRQASLDRVLTTTGLDLQRILAGRRSDYGGRLDRMERELARILTPAQLAGWRKLRSRDLKRMNHRRQSQNRPDQGD